MKGRETLQRLPRGVMEPLVVLVGLVIFELILLMVGLLLVESGWRPAHAPAPMVTSLQLPDVPGDGS